MPEETNLLYEQLSVEGHGRIVDEGGVIEGGVGLLRCIGVVGGG